ncbi:MAG: MATE family efflux transporter, partial [Hungatella sp.]
MKKNIDLLNGPIFTSLTRLALPIMATSLVQMAYNLTDMAWIGRVGAESVAAVGTAGMYTWLAQGVAMLPKMGG